MTEPTRPLPPADDAVVLAPHYRYADRVFGITLLIHFGIGLALAPFYDTWAMAVLVGGAAVGMFGLARRCYPASFASRTAFGVAVQMFVALHIYQMHGLPEMHFFFFTAFAVMLVGYDWRAMWPGALLIIGQHIWFAVLTNAGVPVYFFGDDYVGFWKLFFHFGIAIVHVAVCGAWADHLRKRVLADAGRTRQLVDAEQARRAAERIALDAQRSESMGVMAGGVAHHFNNLLTVIQGHLTLASEMAPAGSPVPELLAPAADAAQRAAGLCEQLQLFVAPAPAKRTDADLAVVLGDFVGLLRLGVPDDARLGLDLDPTPTVRADVPKLRQLAVNLVTNAGEAVAGRRGTVTLRTGGDVAEAWLEVADDGPGMTDDVRARMFDPFYSTKFVGRGLGLPAVRGIATAHDARVDVTTAPGRGTTIRVTFPVTASVSQPTGLERVPTPAMVMST